MKKIRYTILYIGEKCTQSVKKVRFEGCFKPTKSLLLNEDSTRHATNSLCKTGKLMSKSHLRLARNGETGYLTLCTRRVKPTTNTLLQAWRFSPPKCDWRTSERKPTVITARLTGKSSEQSRPKEGALTG